MISSRPVRTFCLIALGVGWPVLSWPLLAARGLLVPSPPLPVLVLGVTYGVLVPAALVLTGRAEGGASVRRLLVRATQWRFGQSWWFVVVAAVPLTGLVLGVLLGGSLQAGASSGLIADLTSLAGALLAIQLAEELVWAGFVQTRLAARFGPVRGAALTGVPFAGIHLPLVLAGCSSWAAAGHAVLGLILMAGLLRIAIGLVLTEAAGSILAAALLHVSFNGTNNTGSFLDDAIDGIDHSLMAVLALALVALTLAGARLIRRRTVRPSPPGRVRPEVPDETTDKTTDETTGVRP